MKTILSQFIDFININYELKLKSYEGLHKWSIEKMPDFWDSIVKFFDIEFDYKSKKIYDLNNDFINTKWFTGSKISYANNVFKNYNNKNPAIKFFDESSVYKEISWNSLKLKTIEFQNILIKNKIKAGDIVVGYCTNSPETIAAFLAVNSIGAIWSSCSPEFGFDSVNDRFSQLKPKILFFNSTYKYSGRSYSLIGKVKKIRKSINSIVKIIDLNNFSKFENNSNELILKNIPVDFNHPIWILFSSGTTGIPKAITHRTGGIILEHFKALAIHQNVIKNDNYFWYSTTGWMMWNYSLSCLLLGATLCIYDGSSNYPKIDILWDFIKKANINHFGHGSGYFQNLMENYSPDLKSLETSSLVTVGSTGSPLYRDTNIFLNKIFKGVHIISLSGGTDVCTAFIGGNINKKVNAGEIQCKMLGASVEIWDSDGKKIKNRSGELVLTKPLITMPLYFWNDPQNIKYKSSYFSKFKNIWTHGDWVTETKKGGFIVHGRSDSTLNRSGVRIGTSEIYSAVQTIDRVEDSLIIHIDQQKDILILYIKSPQEISKNQLISVIRDKCSPRHVPDLIYSVPDIPYTLSGKKVELPIKKILMGEDSSKVISKDSLRNPESIKWYENFYENFFRISF